jgi:ketosteroid isomerase-like protein
LRAQHQRFGFVPGGKETPNLLSLDDVVVREWGEMAVVSAIWRFRRGGAGGPVQCGPCTIVLTSGEDGYRIVHTHFSDYESSGG